MKLAVEIIASIAVLSFFAWTLVGFAVDGDWPALIPLMLLGVFGGRAAWLSWTAIDCTEDD